MPTGWRDDWSAIRSPPSTLAAPGVAAGPAGASTCRRTSGVVRRWTSDLRRRWIQAVDGQLVRVAERGIGGADGGGVGIGGFGRPVSLLQDLVVG